jgi:hypothetical protein
VYLGEITVEHDHVVPVHRNVSERVGAVERDVHGDALSPEALRDGGGEPPVIFCNQNPHVVSPGLGHRMPDSGDNEVTAVVTVLSPPSLYNGRAMRCRSQEA